MRSASRSRSNFSRHICGPAKSQGRSPSPLIAAVTLSLICSSRHLAAVSRRGRVGWLAVTQRCGDDWLHEVKYDGHRMIRHGVRRAKRAAAHRPIRVRSHTAPARAISRSAVSSGARSCSTAEIAVPDERGCHPDILGRILRVDRDFVRYYAAPSGTSGRGSFWSGFRTECPRQKRTRSMPTSWRSSKASPRQLYKIQAPSRSGRGSQSGRRMGWAEAKPITSAAKALGGFAASSTHPAGLLNTWRRPQCPHPHRERSPENR